MHVNTDRPNHEQWTKMAIDNNIGKRRIDIHFSTVNEHVVSNMLSPLSR